MECANCGSRYARFSLGNSQWCPKDHVFFCHNCVAAGPTCPSCGSRLSVLGSMLLFMGIVLGLSIGLGVGAAIPSDLAELHLNAEHVTPISELLPGTTSKVFGTISAGQGSVIVVFHYQDSAGNRVTGRHVENFWLNDSTGRVWVEMGSNFSSVPTIASGGQPYPSSGVPTGYQYESGDPLSVVGAVRTQGNETILNASAVAASPSGFASSTLLPTVYALGAVVVSCFAVAITGVVVQRRRLAIHLGNLPAWTSRRPKALLLPPAVDRIEWIDNPYLTKVRLMGFVANLVSLGVVIAFLIIVVSPIVFPDSIYFPDLLATPLILLFTGVFGASYWYLARHGVRRLGNSPNGLYLDYKIRPKNQVGYLAWSDVREIEAPLPANKRAIRLDTPLHKVTLPAIDPSVIPTVRAWYLAAKAPLKGMMPGGDRPILSTGATAVTLPIAGNEWLPNPARTRLIYTGLGLAALELPVLLFFVLDIWGRVGLNQGDVLFFLPLLYGGVLAAGGWNRTRSIGISNQGLGLRQGAGERTIAWNDMAEVKVFASGLRYKSPTGFAEVIGGLDPPLVRAIVARRDLALGGASPSLSPPPRSAWEPNPVRKQARSLLLLMGAAPAVVMAASGILLVLDPSNVFLVFSLTLPVLVIVFALYPWLLFRSAPARLAVSNDGLFVERPLKRTDPSQLSEISWRSVARLTSSLRGVGGIGWLPGIPYVNLEVKTTSGVIYTVGAVSPALARSIASHLGSAQLTEWKLPA